MAAGSRKGSLGRSLTTTRVVISVMAGVALISVLLTVRGTSVDARNAVVVVAAWWLSPLGYYWFRVATVVGAWAVGAAYIGASAWALLAIYRSSDSTATLSFLFQPMLLWAGMLMAVDVERALAFWASRRRQLRSGGSGQQDQAGVRGRRAGFVWWQWMVPTGIVLAVVGIIWWSIYPLLAAVIWSVAGAVVAKAAQRQEDAR